MNDVTLYFKDFSGELPKYVTKDKGHGRIEVREYQFLTNILWLEQREEWENLQGVEIVKSIIKLFIHKRILILLRVMALFLSNEKPTLCVGFKKAYSDEYNKKNLLLRYNRESLSINSIRHKRRFK